MKKLPPALLAAISPAVLLADRPAREPAPDKSGYSLFHRIHAGVTKAAPDFNPFVGVSMRF